MYFLGIRGILTPDQDPVDRVTQDTVRAYLRELRECGNSPYTVRNRIGELLSIVRAFAPDHDWSWPRRLYGRLDAEAHPVRDKLPRLISAAEITAWAFAAMDEAELHLSLPCKLRAVHYRDALMIALLIQCPLMRRGNLTNLAIHQQLRRTV